MRVQVITITKQARVSGSNARRWNVDLNGAPFGQIWTFRNTKSETHRFHVQTLSGFYADFASYYAAETAIRGQM